MKTTTLIIVMAALCLNFSTKALAQSPANKAIDVTTKGIQVGAQVPENTILSKYSGKFIILDFWATWCSPCLSMIPKMEALQEQFKDQLQIIPVTYQPEKEVTEFLTKFQKGKPSNLPVVAGDAALHRLFPHIYLPHYVWIDQKGVVKAITGMEAITAENIAKVLKTGNTGTMEQKHDVQISHNPRKPLLIDGNGGNGSNLIYHSLLTGYTEGLPGLFSVIRQQEGGTKILYINTTVMGLFKRAYTTYDNYYGKNRIILEVADKSKLQVSLRGTDLDDWMRKYGYCYELVLPPHLADRAGIIMQQEFDKLIPDYTAKVVNRKVRCLALVRTSTADKLHWKSGQTKSDFSKVGFEFRGQRLNMLMLNLNSIYLQHSELPIVDKTGYKEKVDLLIQANLSNVAELNEALNIYDLKLEERELDLDMLVISDRQIKAQTNKQSL